MTEAVTQEDIIIRSARLRTRLELGAYKALLRQLYGDEAFREELRQSDAIDRKIEKQGPPPKEARKGLHRWWGWRLRSR